MNYLINQEQLKKISDLLKESFNEDDFSREDYVEIFLEEFKKFLQKKYGDSLVRAPLSYHLKKDMNNFLIELDLIDDEDDAPNFPDIYDMETFGKKMVSKGIVEMPSLYKTERFLNKHRKKLDFFINRMDIPNYLQISFSEDEPYEVDVKICTDYLKFMTFEEEINISQFEIVEKLKKSIENYLGIEVSGNRSHGDLAFKVQYDVCNRDELTNWINNTFKKDIVKKLRSAYETKNIHSVQLIVPKDYGKLEIKFKYKSNSYNRIKSSLVRDVLKSEGLNPAAFNIYTT